MSYTTIGFFLFVAATVLLYFLFPVKKYQWTVLLAASYFFYLYASVRGAVYILITTGTTYGAALWLDHVMKSSKAALKEHKSEWDRAQKKEFKRRTERKKRWILAGVLVLNFGILAFVKYYNFAVESLGRLPGMGSLSDHTLRLLVPLGISFYTFQSMGYVIDVARGQAEAERNLGKFALFVSFFPQIIQGPIGVYSHLAHQLYEPHKLEFTRFKHGCELILWGYFKKLVIADRALIALNAVIGDYTLFNGSTITFALLLYALQIYADFSGGIDISRGVAQILGIDMAENFKRPYFSTSINDFWRRWHITLGVWMKNYLFYPIALSDAGLKTTDKLRKTRFGQTKAGDHIAKVLPTCFATLVVFLVVGIWHGAEWKCVVYGLYYSVIIILSTLLNPVFKWTNEKLHINTASMGMRVFRILRTFFITVVGGITELAPDVRGILGMTKRVVTDQNLWEAWGQIQEGLILRKADYVLLGLCSILIFVVSVIQERHSTESLREILDRKPYIVRGGLIFFCIMAILVFGIYGGSYDPADFVYMQF